MDELKKYEVIKNLVDNPGANKDRAAMELGRTERYPKAIIHRRIAFGWSTA